MGMHEPGGCPHLPLEEYLGFFRFHELRGQHLEGDGAVHGDVHRLEDAPHAPLADLIQNAVLAQHEAAGAAGQKLLGLKLGEHPVFHQGPGDRPAALGLRQPDL